MNHKRRKRHRHSAKTHVCKLCGRAYSSKDGLDSHSLGRNCQKRELVTCHRCPRSFGSTNGLNYHLRSWHKQKVENNPYQSHRTLTTRNKISAIHSDFKQARNLRSLPAATKEDGFESRPGPETSTTNIATSVSPVASNSKAKVISASNSYSIPDSSSSFRRQYFFRRYNSCSTVPASAGVSNSNAMTMAKVNAGSSFCKTEAPSNYVQDTISTVEPIGDVIFCQVCHEKFYDPSYLNLHVINEHLEVAHASAVSTSTNEGNIAGDQDNLVPLFPTESFIPRCFKNEMMATTNLKCRRCFKIFSTEENLNCHKKLHRGHIVYVCKICGKRFFHFKRLIDHELNTHFTKLNDNIHQANYKSSMKYDEAAKVDDEMDKLLNCFLCDFTSLSDHQMKQHVLNNHSTDDEQKIVHCPYCDFITNKIMKLFSHIRKHDEEKPYFCGQCGKKFRTKYSKRCHDITHTTTFSCNRCTKSYKYQKDLERHIRNTH